jgi:hypothetical protein
VLQLLSTSCDVQLLSTSCEVQLLSTSCEVQLLWTHHIWIQKTDLKTIKPYMDMILPWSFVSSPWAGTFQNLMLLVEVDDILSNKTVAKELSYMCNLYHTDEWYLSLITVVYYICVFLSQLPGESCPCKVLLFLNLFSVSICDESTIIGPHMRLTIMSNYCGSVWFNYCGPNV